MSQGKRIDLSTKLKNQIHQLYKSGKNRELIAMELGITDWAVRKELRGYCDSSIVRAQFLVKRNGVKLTKTQIQCILGTLLGDASLSVRKRTPTSLSYQYSATHCLAQEQYVKHIATVLKAPIYQVTSRGSFSHDLTKLRIHFQNKYALSKIASIVLTNGKKYFSDEWASMLEPEAIAYWFMDDGSSSFCGKTSILTRFSTLAFSSTEIQRLRKRLNVFGIETTTHKSKYGLGQVISIRQNSANLFFNLIKPYIIPSMCYKMKEQIK